MKILVLSSQAANTGSNLRAYYIYRYLKKSGADAHYIKPPFNSMPFMADFLLSMFYYYFRILNMKYDFVFIVKPYPNTVLPALLAKASGAKIIIDIDDLDHGYRAGPVSALTKLLQAMCRGAAVFFTTHNRQLYKMIEKSGAEVVMLPQCVDTEIFNPGVKPCRTTMAEKKKRKKPFLFYMAHLNIAGYLDEIIEAFKMLKTEAVLVVAGGGPMIGYYRKKVKAEGVEDSVIFTGPVTPAQAAAMAKACDLCLVYYTNAEVNKYRASMKMREYLAMNMPVVATKTGEISEFSRYAYLCSSDIVSFARETAKRIFNLDKREKKGYKMIREKYNWGIEAEKFLNTLKVHKIG